MSTIPEYFFPAKTHTLSSLNTLQNPIPGLHTPNDSLTSPDSPQLTHIVSRAASAETEGAIRYAAEQGSPLSRLLTLSSATSYSGSKNCPNVWLFQKNELTTNQENSVK